MLPNSRLVEPGAAKPKEGAHACSRFIVRLYGRTNSEIIRSRLRRFVLNAEGGPRLSLTIREILRRFHKVEIGLYSLAPCITRPGVFQPGTTAGRYAYIADSVRTFTRNHPLNLKSTHAFFYNPALGKAKVDLLPKAHLFIGNGVWIGHNAIILPPTKHIGDGALITAGSVVFTDVPPYAIVSGFPARVVGSRFRQESIARLIASRWWERRPSELADAFSFLDSPPCQEAGTFVEQAKSNERVFQPRMRTGFESK